MPYAPALRDRYLTMCDLLRERRLDEALEIAEDICTRRPDVAMSHANLAMVREAMDADCPKAEAGFRRALELEDDYLFARTGLTRLLCLRGQLAQERAMLAPAMGRQEYHFSEWRSILLAQRAIALLSGEPGALEAIDDGLNELEAMERG